MQALEGMFTIGSWRFQKKSIVRSMKHNESPHHSYIQRKEKRPEENNAVGFRRIPRCFLLFSTPSPFYIISMHWPLSFSHFKSNPRSLWPCIPFITGGLVKAENEKVI